MRDFLRGIPSVFDLGDYRPDMNWRDDRTDREKLASAWETVGDDMRKAIRELEKQLPKDK